MVALMRKMLTWWLTTSVPFAIVFISLAIVTDTGFSLRDTLFGAIGALLLGGLFVVVATTCQYLLARRNW